MINGSVICSSVTNALMPSNRERRVYLGSTKPGDAKPAGAQVDVERGMSDELGVAGVFLSRRHFPKD